jgi:hypothetical protein
MSKWIVQYARIPANSNPLRLSAENPIRKASVEAETCEDAHDLVAHALHETAGSKRYVIAAFPAPEAPVGKILSMEEDGE